MQLVLVLPLLAALAAADMTLTAEPFTHDLTGLLKSWADGYPVIRSLIEAKTAALPFSLQQVTAGAEFAHLSQAPAMQAVDAVEAAGFDAFIGYLMDSLEIGGDKRMGFLEAMWFIKNADSSDWSLVDVVFGQGDGASCRYAGILARKNVERDTYDFMIADFKSSFQLGSDDILVIGERKSHLWGQVQPGEIRAQRIPASLLLQDAELLMTSLSQAALARFAEMLGIQVPGLDAAFGPIINALNSVIDAGISIVPKLINVIKTTSTSSVIREIAGQGFTHFVQSARTHVSRGITDEAVMDIMIPNLSVLMHINSEVLNGAKIALQLGMYSDTGTWSDFKIVFSDSDAENTVRFFDVVCSNRGDDKFDIILVNVAQTFALAPNVQYIEHTKSYVGGIYSKTVIERKVIPKSLTEDDLKVLMGFFHITVFKRLAETYKLDFPALPDKPLKP